MTVDPNAPNPEATKPELALEIDGDEPAADKPAPAAAPTLDVDAVAEAVIGKLMKAAETQPAPAEPAAPVDPNAVADWDEMNKVVRSGDRSHPLFSTWSLQLAFMEEQRINREWDALQVPPGHPARGLFNASPQTYSNMPRFAVQAWQLDELKKTSAADRAKAEKAEKDRADGQRVRDSAPGMPSRSVGGSTRTGTEHMTHAEFDRRVANEPILDDKLDRGLIVFTD